MIPSFEIFNVGNLKWLAMLLGMEDMSNIWCIYCLLRKLEWMRIGHEKSLLRTMEMLKKLANDPTLTGVARMGVKFEPLWDFLKIWPNFGIPHLHKCIGVFNDIMENFENVVEWKIIIKSPEEMKLYEEFKVIDDKIKQHQDDLTKWTTSTEGNRRKYLLEKKKDLDKKISEGKKVDKYLSQKEISKLQELEAKHIKLVKDRDTAKRRKETISKKLKKYSAGRKLDTKSVHNQLEDHAEIHKLSKGKLFGGSYQGPDARKVMENPRLFFDGFCKILLKKENRNDTVTDELINKLCDDTIKLLELWDTYFSLMNKEKPTDEDIKTKAPAVAEAAVRKHQEVLKNITPKVHLAEYHAVDQFQQLPPGMVRLLVEQWVEVNHQISKKKEAQHSHMPDHQKRANSIAKSQHKSRNPDIIQRINEVKNHKKRGPYKKKKKEQGTSDSVEEEGGTAAVSPSPQKTSRAEAGDNDYDLVASLVNRRKPNSQEPPHTSPNRQHARSKSRSNPPSTQS